MILELAMITVRASTEEEFERVFADAVRLISASPGYVSHELRRSIETPNRYALTVHWRTLEDHTVGFRGSPAFGEWRAQLAPFVAGPPVVEHFHPGWRSMTDASAFAAAGGCTCRAVRYRMLSSPLIVHCCHCRWCQRETGSAFVLNALIEADRLQTLQGTPEVIDTPSNSGKGQRIRRCPLCRVALWSNYAGAGDKLHFVRVGTLDEPDRFPPDIHIFTESKQLWVVLPAGARAVPQYYNSKEVWSAASLTRRQAIFG